MISIAIVTPWFGKELKGGAEQQAWQIAHRLSVRGYEIHVVTTCCRSFFDDWGTNHLKAGITQENGTTVYRFAVNNRDRVSFESVNRLLLNVSSSTLKAGLSPLSIESSKIFFRENINSDNLLEYLKATRGRYSAYIFIPYLYGPIVNGLAIVAESAYLQPCLHDEVYAYLPEIEFIFRKAKGILFNSEGELLLAQKIYGPGIVSKSWVVGEGVEAIPNDNPTGLNRVGPLDLRCTRFVLYLGRRDPTKNVDLLVSSYCNFRANHPDSRLHLVLAGPGNSSYNQPGSGIVDLGLVSEDEKIALLKHSMAVFQPSRNESYSRVMMEAWFHRKPVVVNKECLATAAAVRAVDGGWLAGSEDEWADIFHAIQDKDSKSLSDCGNRGFRYAESQANWDKVINRYEKVLFEGSNSHLSTDIPRKLGTIHQLLPDVAWGDAISNWAISIKQYLRRHGYISDIFVLRCPDERLLGEIKFFRRDCISSSNGLLYHHSIGSDLTVPAINHSGPKCLIYHNITPAKFFRPYRPDLFKLLGQGREELSLLSSSFPLSVGDSAFNAQELRDCGFVNPGVLPICVDPSVWNHPAESAIMDHYQDGKTNLLFVGRIAPNKCQHHLIDAFQHYRSIDPESRLILVGYADRADPYYQELSKMIQNGDLKNSVHITNRVNDAELQAFYRTAHLFWSMSEHEGFGVPLVEAMWFNLPVCAYKSSAVPETLGMAGIMFNTKEDLRSVAALAKLVVKDSELNAKIIRAQQKRRNDFLPENVFPSLENIIRKMENAT